MEKTEMAGRVDSDRADVESPRREGYCTPTLTVVGTVHDLTLGIANSGAFDSPGSLYRTGGGG